MRKISPPPVKRHPQEQKMSSSRCMRHLICPPFLPKKMSSNKFFAKRLST